MQIDKLAISTQPRSSWQSFDLGCRLAMQWWRQLYGVWLVLTLPIFILISIFDVTYAMLAVWLLKPLFERALLYILSRQVFAEEVSIKQAIKAWPSQLKNQWFASITWRRLAPSRGFDLSVVQLEGLNSFKRSGRLRILHQSNDDNTSWWLIICVHIEMLFVFAILALMQFMVPQGVDLNVIRDMWLLDDSFYAYYSIAVYLSWLFIAPIHIGGSFAAYLNRRIILEGWDIELTFKKITRKLQPNKPTLSIIACLLCLGLFTPIDSAIAQQEEPPEDVAEISALTENTEEEFSAHIEQLKADLQEIKSSPPFGGKEMVKDWRWTGWEWKSEKKEQENVDLDWLTSFFAILAKFSELILWIVFGGIIVILLWLTRHQTLALFRYRPKAKQAFSMPSFVFAEENNNALPENIHQALRSLIDSQAFRQALSLMLVASLRDLGTTYSLALHKAMTEGECLKVLEQQVPPDNFTFMKNLINVWRKLAWAHQTPSASQLNILADSWQQLFGQQEHGDAK